MKSSSMIPVVEQSLMVRMANDFAQQAPYQLNTRTHYLFWYYLSRIDPFLTEVDDVVIPIKDIRDLLIANSTFRSGNNVKHWGNFKEEVEQSVLQLKEYAILMPSANEVKEGGEIVNEPVSIFTSITAVREGDGPASYKFVVDPRMKGHLYALAHKYVSFQLLKNVRVKHKYACRLYPALKSRADSQRKYKSVPMMKFALKDFRQLLMIPDGKYTKSYDFKRYVITKAIEDINDNSDVRVWVDYNTKGRKLTGIEFYIVTSKYNNLDQLSLKLHRDDKTVSFLKRNVTKQFYDLNIKEFVAFYPRQYPLLKMRAEKHWIEIDEKSDGAIRNGRHKNQWNNWIEASTKSYMLDFIKQELDIFESDLTS